MNRTMTHTMRLFPLLVATSLVAAGCTASKATGPTTPVKSPTTAQTPGKEPAPPPISNTAKARFEDAVKAGATHLRVGRSILGERPLLR